MNAVMRSTHKMTAKKAILRRSQKATISYEGTREVPLASMEKLLETLSDAQRALRVQISQIYRGMGKSIPTRYIGLNESEIPLEESGTGLLATISSQDKKSLKYISAMQELEKALAQKEESWHRNVITRQLVEKTIAFATASTKARTARLLFELKRDPNLTDAQRDARVAEVPRLVPLPKMTSAVVGMELLYGSSMHILPEDYPRLAAFLERYPEENRWFAPQECRNAEGKLLPMSQRWENLCLKNLKIKGPVAQLTKEVKEALAWRWLIISHNHVNKSDRVDLPPKLTLSYERSVKKSPAASSSVDKESLSLMMTEFRKSLLTPPVSALPQEPMIRASDVSNFIGHVFGAAKAELHFGAVVDEKTYRFTLIEGKEKGYASKVNRWNTVMDVADGLMASGAAPEPMEAAYVAGEVEMRVDSYLATLTSLPPSDEEDAADAAVPDDKWALDHPEFLESNGVTFFRCDIEILDVAEGQEYRVLKHNGVEYYAIIGTASGPAKGKTAKGKTAVRPATPPIGKPKEKRVEGKEKSGSPKGPILTQENPLRVKGEAKSKALSDGQRLSLRQFFKLEEGQVPADVWATLSNKERSAEMAKRSIPRWASEAVLRSANNLQLIIEGKLTKENANSAARVPKVAMTKSSSQAMEAWQQLKADFKGTPLFRNPVSGKEKAFKKRFDQLVSDYGQQPCFPKLRERPDQQGRSPSRGRGSSGQGGQFLEMAKAFGEIARAFSGRSN